MEKWFVTIYFGGESHSQPLIATTLAEAEAEVRELLSQDEIRLEKEESLTIIRPSLVAAWTAMKAESNSHPAQALMDAMSAT